MSNTFTEDDQTDATTDGVVAKSKAAVASAAQSVAASAQAAGSRIAEGTEHFSAEARERIIAAREAALAAGKSTQRLAQVSQRKATGFFEDQPLVVGALAMAVGAAIGGLIPRTRFEDSHIGGQSDELIARAEEIYEEERRKLGAVAGAAETAKDDGPGKPETH